MERVLLDARAAYPRMRPGSSAVGPLVRAVALVFVLLVAGAAIGSGGGAAVSTAAEDGGLTMWIDLEADGNATWNVTTTVTVADDSDRQAFERLAESFESGESGASFSVGTFRAAAREASEATGRDMTIDGVEREAVLQNRTGRLTLRFEWTNFANVTGASLRVDDAFATPEGTWLPTLESGQKLVVEPPSGYSAESASPGAKVTNGRFEWRGPQTFGPGQPFGIYRNPDLATTTTTSDPGPELPASLPFVGAAVVALALVGAGIFLWTRRDAGGDTPAGEAATDGSHADAGGDSEGDAAGETAASGADDTSSPTAGPVATGAGAGVDALLSDEERVERLLEANGGRMKQADIVDETGWSNAKVSQLLSEMADDGRVEKLRIGRENLISLPGEDLGEFDN